MANVKITALSELFANTLSSVDVVPIVDISANETKRIKLSAAINEVAAANDYVTYSNLSSSIQEVDSALVDFAAYSNNAFASNDGIVGVETRRADNTFYSYNTHSVSTSANVISTANSNLGAITFPWATTFTNTVNLGNFELEQTLTPNVSISGSTIFSRNKNIFNSAKLIVNIKDLTYGQHQASEILLVHDTSTINLTEYAIVHTSTNPIATFSADFNGDNVELTVSAESSDNTITVLQFIN